MELLKDARAKMAGPAGRPAGRQAGWQQDPAACREQGAAIKHAFICASPCHATCLCHMQVVRHVSQSGSGGRTAGIILAGDLNTKPDFLELQLLRSLVRGGAVLVRHGRVTRHDLCRVFAGWGPWHRPLAGLGESLGSWWQ